MSRFHLMIIVFILVHININAFCQIDYLQDLEPEYIGNIVYIKSKNSSTLLEKQKPTMETKGVAGAAFGVGKAKAYYALSGIKSLVRINEKDSLKFIIKVEKNNLDPYELIKILKLEQNANKNMRFLNLITINALRKTTENSLESFQFTARKFGESSYLIQLTTKLTSGEYSISYNKGIGSDYFYLFGID